MATFTDDFNRGGLTQAPIAIRNLIIATCAVAIICALLNPLFLTFFRSNGPQYLLSLSQEGLSSWYIWQPLSYFFVLPEGASGLSISFFFDLLLAMYILWTLGSSLALKVGTQSFLRFYFICGAAIGLITLLELSSLGLYSVLSGPIAIILALLTAWTMFHPESDLMLFFLVVVKSKWLLVGSLALFLLIDLSNLNAAAFLFHLNGFLIGYLYATLVWGVTTPFAWTHPVDHLLASLGNKARRLAFRTQDSSLKAENQTKVFDIHTGKAVVSDDRFMDEMLEKISRQGEHSLSWSERRRMRKISEKKSRKL